jgi:hypothetical protein
MRRRPVEVLWCSNRRNEPKRSGWSFPSAVGKKIEELCAGGTVLHLFGGQSSFGMRLDVDRATNPHVIGDAWVPPFKAGSFDTVVLDPPYFQLDREQLGQLMMATAYVARFQAIWLHQLWAPSQFGFSLDRAWMVRVADNHYVRCLQLFRRTARSVNPPKYFTRGPQMKYNRWLAGELPLPFLPFATADSAVSQ